MAVGNIGLSASSESIYQTKRNRNSTRHRLHRSSRRNKENGSGSISKKGSFKKSNVSVHSDTNNKKNSKSGINSIAGSDISGTASSTTNDKVLKTSQQSNSQTTDENMRGLHGSKSRIVSFNEMPIVAKVVTTDTLPME